jgi:transposase-like protein
LNGVSPDGRLASKRRRKRYYRRTFDKDQSLALRDRLAHDAMARLGWHPDEISAALAISRVHVYRSVKSYREQLAQMEDHASLLG